MDYFPNQQGIIWFCDKVLPLIQAKKPRAKLLIVGAEPSQGIRRLGERPGVTVTGTVPDVRSYVRQSVLSVAPLMIARGTQNKILESMAMGVPVVCSSTAAGGVDAVPGQHLLVAGPEDQYADNIVRLLANTEARRELSMSARQRVLDRHSWPASMSKLDEIVRSVMEPSA
jgi:glycosyltransferase involved in cell wall biosynthesis